MQNIEKTKERCACRCHLPLKTTHLCPNCFNGQCEKEEIKELQKIMDTAEEVVKDISE